MHRVLFWLFCTVLFTVGLMLVLLPKQTYSEAEKRPLTKLEHFNINSWFSKKYSKMLDTYIADHFPYRIAWIKTANVLKQSKGIQDKEIAFIDPVNITPKIENKPTIQIPKIENKIKKDTVTKKYFDNLTSKDTTATTETEQAIYSNGILIYKNMALQFFGGNDNMAKYFAKVMNEYHSALSPKKISVHCIIPPSSGAYYIPQKLRKGTSEKDNLDIIRSHLNNEIHMPRVYEILEEHQNEYIYFNTDHHWTGLGAYYAYTVFCQEAGLEPIPLEKMQRKVIHKFLGSLYYLLQDKRLYKGIDSVVYFKVPIPSKMYVYSGEGYKEKKEIPLYAEYARGGASYGVFTGADHRFLEIITPLNNGKRAIVLKNSYGNPVLTYLTQHFEKIIAIDYRYYEGKGVLQLAEQHNITDVILVTTSVFANSNWHSDRLKIVLKK